MKIQGAFEAALLKYIQNNVNQMAESIIDYDEDRPMCWGHSEDDSCCCDTSVKVQVRFRLPREVNRFGLGEWDYSGDTFALIRMLDRTVGAGE